MSCGLFHTSTICVFPLVFGSACGRATLLRRPRGVTRECPFSQMWSKSSWPQEGVSLCQWGFFSSVCKARVQWLERTTPLQLKEGGDDSGWGGVGIQFTFTTFSIITNKKRSSWAGLYSQHKTKTEKFHTKHLFLAIALYFVENKAEIKTFIYEFHILLEDCFIRSCICFSCVWRMNFPVI